MHPFISLQCHVEMSKISRIMMEEGQAQPHIKRQEPRHEHPKPNQEHLGQRKERLG